MSTDDVTIPVEGGGVGSMTVESSEDGARVVSCCTNEASVVVEVEVELEVDMSVVVEVDVELEVVDDELVVSDAEEDTADMVLLLTDGSGTNKTSPA
jgi:hypothetical protein